MQLNTLLSLNTTPWPTPCLSPDLSLSHIPLCLSVFFFYRDVLPFTLKLPDAIVSATTSADLEEIAKLGPGLLSCNYLFTYRHIRDNIMLHAEWNDDMLQYCWRWNVGRDGGVGDLRWGRLCELSQLYCSCSIAQPCCDCQLHISADRLIGALPSSHICCVCIRQRFKHALTYQWLMPHPLGTKACCRPRSVLLGWAWTHASAGCLWSFSHCLGPQCFRARPQT